MLSQILAIVEADFDGLDNEPSFLTGAQYLSAQASPPRIVWVPMDEPVTQGRLQDDSLAADHTAVATRESVVEAHVWGASFAQTEALAHCLMTAWRENFTGTGNVNSLRWPAVDEVGWVENGFAAVVQLRVDIPVLDKFVTIPDAPDPAENAAADTTVLAVASSPDENEAVISRGDTTYDVDPLT